MIVATHRGLHRDLLEPVSETARYALTVRSAASYRLSRPLIKPSSKKNPQWVSQAETDAPLQAFAGR